MRMVVNSTAVLRAGHEKPDLGCGSLHVVLSSAHNAQLPLLLFPFLFNGQSLQTARHAGNISILSA